MVGAEPLEEKGEEELPNNLENESETLAVEEVKIVEPSSEVTEAVEVKTEEVVSSPVKPVPPCAAN